MNKTITAMVRKHSSRRCRLGAFGHFRHIQRNSVCLTFFWPLQGRRVRFRKNSAKHALDHFLICQNLRSIFSVEKCGDLKGRLLFGEF